MKKKLSWKISASWQDKNSQTRIQPYVICLQHAIITLSAQDKIWLLNLFLFLSRIAASWPDRSVSGFRYCIRSGKQRWIPRQKRFNIRHDCGVRFGFLWNVNKSVSTPTQRNVTNVTALFLSSVLLLIALVRPRVVFRQYPKLTCLKSLAASVPCHADVGNCESSILAQPSLKQPVIREPIVRPKRAARWRSASGDFLKQMFVLRPWLHQNSE